MPFAWGVHKNDCVSFAAGAVEAQCGKGRQHALPSWTTRRGAIRVLHRLGGLEAAVDRVLTPVPMALAHRGDVALVKAEDTGFALMVIEGQELVGPGASGARRLPRSAMLKAWSAI